MIFGHLTIADGTRDRAGTLMTESMRNAGTYTSAFPVDDRTRDWQKNAVHMRHLDETARAASHAGGTARSEKESAGTIMDITQIMQHLPHRYPFLLVDRVLELEPGKRIAAMKNVTINEPFFPGHFPHYPVMPGVLIIEAMAQAAAILSFKSPWTSAPDSYSVCYFAGIDDARFKRPVTPGDQLRARGGDLCARCAASAIQCAGAGRRAGGRRGRTHVRLRDRSRPPRQVAATRCASAS